MRSTTRKTRKSFFSRTPTLQNVSRSSVLQEIPNFTTKETVMSFNKNVAQFNREFTSRMPEINLLHGQSKTEFVREIANKYGLDVVEIPSKKDGE